MTHAEISLVPALLPCFADLAILVSLYQIDPGVIEGMQKLRCSKTFLSEMSEARWLV